jgi:hypothetical protein
MASRATIDLTAVDSSPKRQEQVEEKGNGGKATLELKYKKELERIQSLLQEATESFDKDETRCCHCQGMVFV